jgi:hypothetical protein
MTNQEKIEFLQDYISGIEYSTSILENDILENPNADLDGKPTRQSVLNDLRSQKESLLEEIDKL